MEVPRKPHEYSFPVVREIGAISVLKGLQSLPDCSFIAKSVETPPDYENPDTEALAA